MALFDGIWSFDSRVVIGGISMENMHIEPGTTVFPIFGGIEISNTILVTWIVMAILISFALVVRFFLLNRFTEVPRGLQNVIEILVETINNFTANHLGEIGKALAPYVLTLALFIFFADLIELFGLRPPTADLSMTAALALITFFLINYFGIRKKGFLGRIKDLGKPIPFIAPIKILTDLAAPVSLACRLFGNILGGLIVMDLIYIVFPFAIPAFLSIYFNLFHAGMQTFIFITLSLTFIGEAVE